MLFLVPKILSLFVYHECSLDLGFMVVSSRGLGTRKSVSGPGMRQGNFVLYLACLVVYRGTTRRSQHLVSGFVLSTYENNSGIGHRVQKDFRGLGSNYHFSKLFLKYAFV